MIGRVLKMAVVVAIAGLSVGASTASAVSFHSDANPGYLLGQQVETTKFRFPSTHFGEFFLEPICKKVDSLGETTATKTTTVQLSSTYSECTSQALAVTIEPSWCTWGLTPVSSGGGFKGSVALSCPAGKELVIRFFSGFEICRIMIAPQTPESTVVLKNEGSPKFVRVTGALKGIKYTTVNVPGSSNCEKPASNGEIVIDWTLKSYAEPARSKNPKNFWVE